MLADKKPTAGRAAGPAYEIAVLRRAMDVLESIAATPGQSLTELAVSVGMNKVSCFRILVNFERRGFVLRDDQSGRYRLGLALLRLASTATGQQDLRALARPAMDRLHASCDETVNLGVLFDRRVLYLDIVESTHGLRMAAAVGSTDDLHSTALGKALLAFTPKEDQAELVGAISLPAKTTTTITDRAALVEELDRTLHRGFAVDNEENEDGARCVGAPIVGADRVVGALSISGPATRITPRRANSLGKLLIEEAAALSRELA